MKRLLSILLIAAAVSATPAFGRDSFSSRLQNNKNKTVAAADGRRSDVVFESVSQAYSSGKISADSVVNLALYHKAWSPEVAARCLKLAADKGNMRAATELGAIYISSPGFADKVEEGVRLLDSAARAGYKEANGYLGYYYFTNKDYPKAKASFEAAKPLTKGFEYAALGSMFVEGNGVEESGAKARENYRQSALMGLPRGMALYASLLGTKNGGPIDYPDAFFWHYIAGDLGDNYSRVMLYRPMLPEPEAGGEMARDAQTALRWIEAVHSGKNMKNEPLYKDGFLKGLKSREQAAEGGDDWSRFYLGGMNYNGDFLNQNYARAIYYYEPIARNGKLPKTLLALVNERLAEMYREGKGTKADASKAASYARAAARFGSLPAYKIVENMK